MDDPGFFYLFMFLPPLLIAFVAQTRAFRRVLRLKGRR
jgi:hypothetical protein